MAAVADFAVEGKSAGHSSVEFFVDIHAAVDHANDGDLIGIDGVKNQIETDHETTQPGSKARTLSTDEGKSG